jgi:aminopeptidase N
MFKYPNVSIWIVLAAFAACAPKPYTSSTTIVNPDTTSEQLVDLGEVIIEEDMLLVETEGTHVNKDYRASATKLFDLQHTRLELSFDWEKQHVQGKARITLSPHFFPQNRLELDAKNFDIHRVALLVGKEKMPLSFEYDGLKLNIALDKKYNRRESLTVSIDYTAKPAERISKYSEAINSNQGLFFVDPLDEDPTKPSQIWTQGETENNSAWFPTIDAPNQRCTQEMFITVDEKFKTLSNGQLVFSKSNKDGTRTDYWKMEKAHAPYLFMLAVGDFAVVEDERSDVPMGYWVDHEYKAYAKDIFGHTPEMMNYFQDLLQYPYPWPKYDQIIVQDYITGAMENTTASVYMGELQMNSRELIDVKWDYIIAHELFHQWFGNLVTCESWSNLTLNEAFANYSEYLWMDYKYGKDEAEYHRMSEYHDYMGEASEKKVDLIRYYYENRDDMFDSHSYAKGGLILHMLRRHIGDDAFFTGLNYYLKKHEFDAVEVHHLRLAFEKVTGQDLNWFFNQWFLEAGHPQLEVQNYYDDSSKQVVVNIYQKHDTDSFPVYQFPVDIKLWNGNSSITKSFYVDELQEQLTIPMNKKPNLVLFDPDKTLLIELDEEKDQQEWYFQLTHAKNIWQKYLGFQRLIEANDSSYFRKTIDYSLGHSFWQLKEEALDRLYFAMDNSDDSLFIQPYLSKVENQAQNDDNNSVRASALDIMSQVAFKDYESLFETNLSDSSYFVVGASLFALMNNPDYIEKDSLAGVFRGEQNINIMATVAAHYIFDNDTSQYDWFKQKLQGQGSETRYYMAHYFGQYLLLFDDLTRRQGVQFLADLAQKEQKSFVRLALYQAIEFNQDLEGVEDILARLKEKESDEHLKRFFDN